MAEQFSFALEVIDPEEHRKKSEVKTRKCLQCRKVFKSESFGHRVCSGCKERSDWDSVPEYSVSSPGF